MELRLKDIINERGITLKDFSLMSGISQSNLSNYLNGNISPTLETLKRIANALDIEIVDLFKEKDELELYVKRNGKFYPLTKKDILELVSKKERI